MMILPYYVFTSWGYPHVIAQGIIPNRQSLLDNSTYKIQFTLFLNFESHYHLRFNEP